MESLLLAIFHIAFVTAVYCAAYRRGVRDAEDRARAMAERYGSPLADLVEKLNRQVEQAVNLQSRNPEDRSRKD